ncbi:MAG: hypothetical protein IT457_00060 [Planctomycetes bacterium]|nr:hypothetical protein [Planctomycetota bacterium]
MAIAVDPVAAQQNQEEVIHLYVDPHYGSDELALGLSGPTWNPDGANSVPLCSGTPLRPTDVVETSTQLPLRHAPQPFRTISAALRYIGATAQRAGLPAGTSPLPYPPSPLPGQRIWTHAIVHLLPGLYAPTTSWYPDFLAYGNGEGFPLVIPPRVSIQGTSGLNTVIMPTDTTAFVFGAWFDPVTNLRTYAETPDAIGSDGTGSFLSCLTIYAGGRDVRQDLQSKMTDQAAVLIDGELAAHPTITNCCFVKNWVGILVNGYAGDFGAPPERPIVEHHGTTIIGNTFAWNAVGLYNGQSAELKAQTLIGFVSALPGAAGTVGYGLSRLALVNNVFDRSAPGSALLQGSPNPFCGENAGLSRYPASGWRHPATWPFAFADSSFEGVGHEDLTVVGFGDSNAYEEETAPLQPGQIPERPYNTGWSNGLWTFLTRLPPVKPGPAALSMPSPDPTRNIAPMTGYFSNMVASGSKPRGVLFVRDLFCFARFESGVTYTGESTFAGELAPGTSGFDGSPLDFRLSPTAAVYPDVSQTPPSRPTVPNPLVDNGFDLPASGTFTMANGLVVGRPGDFGHPNWGFDAWRSDVEGFGNRREHDHPHPGYTGASITDIGADELGDLLVAGYRMGTTMLVRLDTGHPKNPYNGSYALENHRVYILGPANAQSSAMHPGHVAAGHPAPMFRTYGFPSFTTDWPFSYNSPTGGDATWHSVETVGAMFARPWRFDPLPPTNPPPALEFLYLGTTADITPHLLPDPHPWWSHSPGSTLPNGIPPTLTLWQDCLGAGSYNGFLYLPPLAHLPNPPGSSQLGYVDLVGGFEFQWLDGLSAWSSGPPSFGNFFRWVTPGGGSSGLQLNQVDSWCRVRSTHPLAPVEPLLPDTLPATDPDPVAIRFTLESNIQGLFSTSRNIQSFMVLVDGIAP